MMIRFLILTTCFLLCAQPSVAQEITTKVFAANLKNPCGVAIRPVTDEIYIADTGRGRIIQASKNSTEEVIVNFPVQEFELDQDLILGPMGMLFRKRNRLMVAMAGSEDGEDSIAVFDIGEIDSEPVAADAFEYQMKIPAAGDELAEGDFMSIAKSKFALYISCNGDSSKGWVAKTKLLVNDLGSPQRFIATNQVAKTPGPGGMAINPQGLLAVAQMGTRDVAGDSVLTFYNEAGELLDKFPTGLSDIVALAYSPRKKRLFALDYNWAEPKKGGLYKLVANDSKDGCVAELVTLLERPTAMAFNKRGDLYVTVCGFPDEEAETDDEFAAPGKCILIKGVD